MSEGKAVFPYTLFNTVGRLMSQPIVARQIAQDQELFSAFFAMAIKTLGDDEHEFTDRDAIKLVNRVASISSKAFSLEQLEGATKLAESIKATLGHHVTSEYMGKFLAFADLFHELYSGNGKGSPGADITKAIIAIGDHIVAGAVKARARNTITTQIEANIVSLKGIYGLNEPETILLEHTAAVSVDLETYAFIQLLERNTERKGAHRDHIEAAFAQVLMNDVEGFASAATAYKAVERLMTAESSKPLAFNMVRVGADGHISKFSQFWTKVIGYDHREGAEGFERMFLIPVSPQKSYSSVIARVNEKMIPLLRDVFDKGITGNVGTQEPGVNVLLYGPSKLDKDQALHRALADIEFDLYEANLKGDGWGDEASITYGAQRLLEEKNFKELMKSDNAVKHVLLVRDAVSVLSKGSSRNPFSFFGDQVSGKPKAEENLDSDELLLTKSKTPTIWYASDPTRLSKEAVGKFMLHLEVVPGTRADRKLEVEKIADTLNLPPEVRQALSKYMELGAVQVETAARVVKLLELEEPGSYETLLLVVAEGQRALGRDKTEEIRTSVTKYDLGLLNIRSKFSPQQVIDALRKKPQATACFYGLPGTGKTQLAEFIADQLDKPLLVKRASDILSKWVGENEQNIAEMFREAEAEGAVLLLDEADSFLRDRALSKNQWEVTMVNELLQGMERFKGIFITASNLFNQLDAAALRRFTFKFNFLELTEAQRIKMFANEAGVELTIDDPRHLELLKIAHLTPGDFATVKRQANLFDAVLTPEDWLRQLAEEAKAKDAGVRRNFTDTELA